MFVFLSSGGQKRYRDDVLRGLARPVGMEMQLRYQLKYLRPDIRQVIEQVDSVGITGESLAKDMTRANTLTNQGLFCFVDQHPSTAKIKIIPCRAVTLERVVRHANSVIVSVHVGDFTWARDLDMLQTVMRDCVPGWDSRRKPKGDYFSLGDRQIYTRTIGTGDRLIAKGADSTYWEEIVKQLARCPDFQDEPYFYTVTWLGQAANRARTVTAREGRYELVPDKEFDIEIYHFHPREAPPGSVISLTATSSWLTFETNPELSVDSRYDLKRVRFKTGTPTTDQVALLSVQRGVDAKSLQLEFDLPVTVRGSLARTFVNGFFLGVFLMFPQLTAIYLNGSLSESNRIVAYVLTAVSGWAAGFWATLRLNKSI